MTPPCGHLSANEARTAQLRTPLPSELDLPLSTLVPTEGIDEGMSAARFAAGYPTSEPLLLEADDELHYPGEELPAAGSFPRWRPGQR